MNPDESITRPLTLLNKQNNFPCHPTTFAKFNVPADRKMYPLSSQKKYWTFSNLDQLNDLRLKRNQKFIETHGAQLNVSKQLVEKLTIRILRIAFLYYYWWKIEILQLLNKLLCDFRSNSARNYFSMQQRNIYCLNNMKFI